MKKVFARTQKLIEACRDLANSFQVILHSIKNMTPSLAQELEQDLEQQLAEGACDPLARQALRSLWIQNPNMDFEDFKEKAMDTVGWPYPFEVWQASTPKETEILLHGNPTQFTRTS
ncbi:unnamed protein product [Caretta caretta]